MNTLQKIKTLGTAANYDTVCGSPRSTKIANDSLTDTVSSFIYKSRSENYDCRLFKVLMTNKCKHDCRYCANRCSRQKNLTEFEPDELADVFQDLRRKGLVNGLFLSSGVCGDSEKTAEKMIKAVEIIRQKYFFTGYVHFKILPGVSRDLVKRAGEIADRLSINIEAPNKEFLSEISSTKDMKNDILKRQRWIKEQNITGGQTTQLIVGSAGESDWDILKTVDHEVKEFSLRRFYFSAFSPVKNTPFENKEQTPLQREKRLYNVEFMLREYGFDFRKFKEILNDKDNLPNIDPKIALANETIESPVDINEASYNELLQVPGIGMKTAAKIIVERKRNRIMKYEHLHKIGTAVERAKPYIKVNGMTQRRLGDWG